MKAFKKALRKEGLKKTALKLNLAFKPQFEDVKKVIAIRNKFVVHTEYDITPLQEREINGLTPNQWRALIDTTCHAINEASCELGITNTIFVSDRAERATSLAACARAIRSGSRSPVTSQAAGVLGATPGSAASLGRLAVGSAADLCIFDPHASWVVGAAPLRSQGRHTPFLGYELPGQVRHTIVSGRLAFSR